jgi:thioredoxin-like negative regulator of GroEL
MSVTEQPQIGEQQGTRTQAAKPRLLFFYTPTDGQARRAEGFLAQVLQRRKNHDTFVVHRLDVGEQAELAERLKVDVTPALVVVDGKRVQARLERPKGCADIQALLGPWLN